MKNCFRIGIKAVGWGPIFIIKVEFRVGKTTGQPTGGALRLCRNTSKAVPDEPNLAVEEGRGVQGTRRVAAFKGWILAFTHLSSHSP